MHVLVVRQNSLRISPKEIVIPNAQQRQNYGDIFLKTCRTEVIVHVVSTGEELLKILKTDKAGNRKSDGGPQRIATADPIPEAEHIFGVNAKFFYFGAVGRNSHKMLRYVRSVFGRLQKPTTCRKGVCHGFLRGEGFGGNHKKRGLRI